MLFETLRKVMLAGFGAQEKFRDMIDELVKKGELSESHGAKLVREWTDKAEKSAADMNKSFGELVSASLEKMNIPSHEDIRKLDKQMEKLSARIKHLEEKG